MAQLINGLGIKPDLLISSPANRAYTTARYFAEGLQLSPDTIQQEAEIYEAYPSTIMRIISGLPASASTVFLFGHNPTFTDVANTFTDTYIDNVPTCGVIHIESTANSWAELYEGNAQVKARYFPKEVL